MLILQGEWIPSLTREHDPHLVLFVEQLSIGMDSATQPKLIDLKLAITAAIEQEKAFTFSNEKVGACFSVSLLITHGSMTSLLKLLMSLRNEQLWDNYGFVIGESLLLWNRVAQLTLELLASDHFIPSMSSTGKNTLWDALIEAPRIEYRLKTITDHHLSLDIVKSFIQTAIDLFVRESFDANEVKEIMKSTNSRYIAPLTPSEHWLQSLFSPIDQPADPSVDWIAEDILMWRKKIITSQNEFSFRTCFRLEQPRKNPNEIQDPWKLRLFIQAADDPSLLVPAELVWKEPSETLEYLNYRFHQPQEKILADLNKATKLFHPLKRTLEQINPIECELQTTEAHLFLTNAAKDLNAAGFGVFIPSWWRKKESQLGVKLKLNQRSSKQQANHLINVSRSFRKQRLGFNEIINGEWQLSIGEESITLEDLQQLSLLKQPLVEVKGQWIEFQPEYVQEATKLFEQKIKLKLSEVVHLSLQTDESDVSPIRELLHIKHSKLPFLKLEAEGEIGEFVDQLKTEKGLRIFEQPLHLKGQLRPYQLNGFSWLIYMRQLNLGACLADDMGLGKTIQWIAYFLYLKQMKQQTGPVLLICPTSVIGNWEQELLRFSPSLHVYVHHGNLRLKQNEFKEKARTTDIVLTSYAVAMRDEADFSSIEWDIVTLDEAQNIKNTAAKQTQAIRKLSANHRIALTGTPVENRLAELWSIMDFLNPGYLGSRDQFIENFEVPIERDELKDKSELLHRMIKPFVLRRLKSDRNVIQDIPDKFENTAYCVLTKEQASLYEACVKNAFEQVDQISGMKRRGTILATITHLKQICNHPVHYLGIGEVDETRSGKLMRLVEMLQSALENGERTLIFTQYAKMAIMLQQFLEKRFQQEVLLIHGRIPKLKRDQLIRRFQEQENAPSIFVLSLKTGGFGLNLTKANHVVHYDRWWNPAVENQATDRAYRIGQQKNVNVYKFLCYGTLEEKIDQLMESKRSLAESVIGKGESWITEMNTNDLKELFMLRVKGESIYG